MSPLSYRFEFFATITKLTPLYDISVEHPWNVDKIMFNVMIWIMWWCPFLLQNISRYAFAGIFCSKCSIERAKCSHFDAGYPAFLRGSHS